MRMPGTQGARLCRRAQRASNRGQAIVEFTIVLTFFLGVLFIVFAFIMLMSMGQMTLYTTFMSARAASVHGDYKAQADALMPRIEMKPSDGEGTVTMHGIHTMLPYLTSGGGALANPLQGYLKLESNVTLHEWPECSAGTAGDNPLVCP